MMKKPACLAILMLLCAPFAGAQTDEAQDRLTLDDLRTFTDVFNQVRKNFVDDVDEHELLRAAIEGMVSTLDPWSRFFDADQFRSFDDANKGRYGGTGLQTRVENRRLVVENVVLSSPADEANILQNDVILAINGQAVRGRKLSQSMDALNGEPGTSVVIRLKTGTRPARDVELQREFIAVPSVRAMLLQPQVAYFKVTQFTQNSHHEFEAAIKSITDGIDSPLSGLILDLRNNPGGVIKPAIEIADGFLEDGLIVSTHSRYEATQLEIKANPGQWLANVPLAVLVNGGTASAAEVLAGALKDRKRAVLIGTRTFGKGSIQSLLKLRNGSALKLTTAHYLTPSGAIIHEQGIEPNVLMPPAEQTKPGPGVPATGPGTEGNLHDGDAYIAEALHQLGVS